MSTDPFRYFRIEARELVDGLSHGVLELEKGPCDPVIVTRLLRLAHTLKGAARVVKQLDIAGASHHIEELITPLRDSTQTLAPGQIESLIALVDSIENALGSLGQKAEKNEAKPPAPGDTEGFASRTIENLDLAAQLDSATALGAAAEEVLQTVRVEVSEMDELLALLTSAGTELAGLKKEVSDLKRVADVAYSLSSRLKQKRKSDSQLCGHAELELSDELHQEVQRVDQNILRGVGRLESELGNARQGAERLRLIPVQTLEVPLSRAARDAARSLGKDVSFELEGGNVRLDSKVLLPLRDALGHVVRNAVAHGIEFKSERKNSGKPPRGLIRLVVTNRGKSVVCACSDDGSGVDETAVRRKMIECGTLGAGEQLSREQLFERMLAGGVSTSREVTQISGRGIGLDAIRETAQQLEGKVSLESEAGRGTKVSFDVPISLASLPALLVECCGMTVAIPLEAVLEARRFAQEDIQRSAQSTSVDIDGKIVPFLPLARALRGEEGRATKKTVSAVVLRSEGKLGAFGVDALYGTADIVVRPLPQGLAAESTVVGMSLDAGGHPRLVLDPTALISSMSVERQSQQEARPHRAPVLVIDDSLTTRMLEQSILESAGYLVELATSGEQGIEKARTNTYSIFLVDVDMPGMSGFEFVEKTRADPDLCKIPAILVTSRNSVEDFERGRKVGAGDYVVKGEFDQSRLLQSIERLLRS